MTPALRVTARLIRYDLRRYVIGTLLWAPANVIPIASGLILQQLFDRISGHRVADLTGPLWLCAAFVGAEVVRGLTLVIAWCYGDYWWASTAALLRANVLRSILTARGPVAHRLPHSTGEGLARLRDDVAELVEFADEGVSLVGTGAFGLCALAVMAAIDPLIALVLVLPIVAIAVLSRLLNRTVLRLRQRAQSLGAAVTARVGEAMGGVLAIKTAGAQDAVLARLREQNRARFTAAVKDRMVTDLLDTATGATAELGVGLVLLLAAPALHRGAFTVGDLALFTSYAGWLTSFPSTIGAILYRLPQCEVSTARLSSLLGAGEGVDELSRYAGVRMRDVPRPGAAAEAEAEPDAEAESGAREEGEAEDEDTALEALDVRGLSFRHPGSARGVYDVDLHIPRGSFTVVTGAVGSGKTTLVRAVLGLLTPQSGTISWNGVPIDDPGTFLRPRRAAYAAQVPRLFSATLRENVLLGGAGGGLGRALTLAALEDDLAGMPQGLETLIGPRGTRLSGGQMQRVAAARALVREPELLVVDDLSSALDVETERLLWQRLAETARDGDGPRTLLVVSHRRAALERADRIVVLDHGRVVAVGALDELLRDCAQLRRLWSEELSSQAQERADAGDPEPGPPDCDRAA